jgi:lipopolysaccharide transport system permease protein
MGGARPGFSSNAGKSESNQPSLLLAIEEEVWRSGFPRAGWYMHGNMKSSLGRLAGEYLSSVTQLVESLVLNRALLFALAKRDISDEYVEHGFSRWWPVVHPLVLMCIYLFIFTYVFPARLESAGIFQADSVIYLMAGIIPWITLSQIMGKATMSIVGNSVIVKQMSFPLEHLAIKTMSGPLSFGLVSLLALVVYALYKTGFECLVTYALGIPILLILTGLFATGVALLFASIQVFFRDFREFVNIFVTAGLFIHPILYFPGMIPEKIQPLLLLSPFTYLLYCWQDVLFFGAPLHVEAWFVAPALAVGLLVLGSRVFMVSKPHFGDFL